MRIVYVIAEYSLHNHILEAHHRSRPGDQLAIVKVPLVLRGKSRADTAQRIVPQLSHRFLLGKLMEAAGMLAITALPKVLRKGPVFSRLRTIASRHRLPFHRTADIMSPGSLRFIADQQPDLVITLFHQIVRQDLIDIPRLGVMNIHPGLLPSFRGIQPYFWELSEGAQRAGATFHFIEDESVDSGAVLAQASYAVPKGVSVQRNYFLTCLAAGQLLPRVLAALESGALEPQPQDPEAGAYWRWPDSAAFDRLRNRGHALVSLRQLFSLLAGEGTRDLEHERAAVGASELSDLPDQAQQG
ncbi:MAG: formyltransferase family protein [Planctomycetota bacterium]|nr:formyltransferase family protein [Planctomycetota bacterium]